MKKVNHRPSTTIVSALWCEHLLTHSKQLYADFVVMRVHGLVYWMGGRSGGGGGVLTVSPCSPFLGCFLTLRLPFNNSLEIEEEEEDSEIGCVDISTMNVANSSPSKS